MTGAEPETVPPLIMRLFVTERLPPVALIVPPVDERELAESVLVATTVPPVTNSKLDTVS